MGLFKKKSCDICGGEIGLLGNKKVDDGNMCKECARKLSPFFTDRRRTSLEDIRAQLDYREANKDRVEAFNVTRTLGNNTKVLLDEDNQCFIVTSSSRNWREENPDVIDFSSVTGCERDIDETRTEIKRREPDGTEVSYHPPRYNVEYDFRVIIHVNCDWFDEIRVTVDSNIDQSNMVAYSEAQRQCEEICQALSGAREEARQAAQEASAPKMARTCPFCGATTTPDAAGRCEFCGGAIGA